MKSLVESIRESLNTPEYGQINEADYSTVDGCAAAIQYGMEVCLKDVTKNASTILSKMNPAKKGQQGGSIIMKYGMVVSPFVRSCFHNGREAKDDIKRLTRACDENPNLIESKVNGNFYWNKEIMDFLGQSIEDWDDPKTFNAWKSTYPEIF